MLDKNIGESYIGDGVYIKIEDNATIRLRTERYVREYRDTNDYIYIEKDMLKEINRIVREQLDW